MCLQKIEKSGSGDKNLLMEFKLGNEVINLAHEE